MASRFVVNDNTVFIIVYAEDGVWKAHPDTYKKEEEAERVRSNIQRKNKTVAEIHPIK